MARRASGVNRAVADDDMAATINASSSDDGRLISMCSITWRLGWLAGLAFLQLLKLLLSFFFVSCLFFLLNTKGIHEEFIITIPVTQLRGREKEGRCWELGGGAVQLAFKFKKQLQDMCTLVWQLCSANTLQCI